MASFYYYTLFTPATCILFSPKSYNIIQRIKSILDKSINLEDKISLASGDLHSVNPLHVILKKKILTGYP